MKSIARSLTLLAVLTGSLGVFALPASAAPSAQEPVVYQLPCRDFVCGPSDPTVPDGGAVTGKVQIKVSASSGLGLRWIELQARKGSGNWFCMRRWNSSSPEQRLPSWDTTSIPSSPSGCLEDSDAPWGSVTGNDAYDLRIQANDTSGTATSSSIGVKLSNRPERPSWASSPRVIGNRTRNVKVELRWLASSDDGIVQYGLIRIGPDGEKRSYINAKSPGGQGCSPSVNTSYTCYDDDFPSETYEGTYQYSLLAYRKTAAATSQQHVSPCRVTSGNCIESPLSDEKTAHLTNPPEPSPEETAVSSPSAPPPSSAAAQPTPSATKTAAERRREREQARVLAERRRQDYLDFFSGDFSEELPFDQRGGLPFPSGPIFGGLQTPDGEVVPRGFVPTPRDTAPYKAAAGGMLMLLSAAHMGRLLRREHAL